MYITLKSVKRNLGLFNLELEDLVIGGMFLLIFTLLFLFEIYTLAIVIIIMGILALVPVDFSKCNRMYKLFILFLKYLFKEKKYILIKNEGVEYY